jgi:Predicted periplasmic ligand-binding sensor domain
MKRFLLPVFLFFVFVDFYSQSNYRFKNYTINEGLSQSLVETIVQDKNYTLWIGTQDGLNKFDGKTFQIIETDNDNGLLSQSITCSEASQDGKVWFGTGKGLTLYDPQIGGFETYNPIKKTISVKSISEDKDGNIWVASVRNGIFLFDLKSKKSLRT